MDAISAIANQTIHVSLNGPDEAVNPLSPTAIPFQGIDSRAPISIAW
jgi:hypothetical protein